MAFNSPDQWLMEARCQIGGRKMLSMPGTRMERLSEGYLRITLASLVPNSAKQHFPCGRATQPN
jgi:hypothetical protein